MLIICLAILVSVAVLKATADSAAPTKVGGSIGDMIGLLDEIPPDAAHLDNLAGMATSAGYLQTAEVLRDKSDVAHAVEKGGKRTDIKPPFDGVDAAAWKKFVALFRGSDIAEISASNQFGLYNIGYRRLADLGLATDVRRGNVNGKSVWIGKFREPLTCDRFLNDAELQYKVFCKDIVDRRRLILSKHSTVIGQSIEGLPATISGLLAVAKIAGAAGLASWIANPAERRKFSQTTAAFKTANGIF